jgi:hypothetical protein
MMLLLDGKDCMLYDWCCEMQALGADGAVGNCSTSSCAPQSVEEVDDDDDLDFENWDGDDVAGRETSCDDPGDEVDDS